MAMAAAAYDASGGEPSFEELEARFASLADWQQRCVLALLGVAIGDCVGLPFELFLHRGNRDKADQEAAGGTKRLQRLVLTLIIERLGKHGPRSAMARTFSDDTACTDLKMSALAQCAELLELPDFAGCGAIDGCPLLWRCYLSQLLAWSRNSRGALMQGAGGFTKGLLRPPAASGRAGASPCLELPVRLLGCDTWPEDWFVQHAEAFCVGSAPGGVASYGNGAVMSYAPQAVAAAHMAEKATVPEAIRSSIGCLSATHRDPIAAVASELLGELLAATLRGTVRSCGDLRRAARQAGEWVKLLAATGAGLTAYPLQAFDAYLRDGDCNASDVLSFVASLTGIDSPPLEPLPSGAFATGEAGSGAHMGQLFRTAANWDDNHATRGHRERICLDGGQTIRFSQRGLNSLLIAIWCCDGAKTTWDWLARVVYVGGDSDTIGAVCGQLACPLLPAGDVIAAFRLFAALGDCPRRAPCADVAEAAMRRYFCRALLFSAGHWRELAARPRLADASYPGLTDAAGAEAMEAPIIGLGGASSSVVPRILWLDRALLQPPRSAVEAARRRFAEDGERAGELDVRRATDNEEALRVLKRARQGEERVDAIVTELQRGHSLHAGLELLPLLDDLWGDAPESRPLYCLLTPYHSHEINAEVRRYTLTCTARHDRPDQIGAALARGLPCSAAQLPACLTDAITITAGSVK